MAIQFQAKVTSGLGAASRTVPLQAPLLAPYFPEISEGKHATVNFQLPFPVQVRLPDIVTPPLLWGSDSIGERFGLSKIDLTLPDGSGHDAWIYTPEGSPHRFNDLTIEVLAKPISRIAIGDVCMISIERAIQTLIL
jgi:hypothetical protein